MVVHCCVTSCRSEWNPLDDISFFSFPWKKEDLLRKWLAVIPTKCKITKYSHICQLHFNQCDYEQKSGKRFLKKDSIPSIFPPKDWCKYVSILKDASASFPDDLQSQAEITNEGMETFINLTNQDHELMSTESEDILSSPKKAKTITVGTQVSPKRLKPSDREEVLQKRLNAEIRRRKRRETRLKNITELMKHLKRAVASNHGKLCNRCRAIQFKND